MYSCALLRLFSRRVKLLRAQAGRKQASTASTEEQNTYVVHAASSRA